MFVVSEVSAMIISKIMAHINYPYIIPCAWNAKRDAICYLPLNEIAILTFKRKHVNDPSATMEVTNINNYNQCILTY